MKKIFLLSCFVFLFSDTIKIIEEVKKIEQFEPKFKSVQGFDIFYFNESKQESVIIDSNSTSTSKKDSTLKIYAIFQDRVNINEKWFKIGDSIDGYEIIKIDKNSILLKKENDKKTLKIFSNDNKLKIK